MQITHKCRFSDKTYQLKPYFEKYRGGNTAIRLVDEESGETYAIATTMVEGLEADEIAVKDYSENEGILDSLLRAGLVTEPHRVHRQGFVRIPICRLNNKSI